MSVRKMKLDMKEFVEAAGPLLKVMDQAFTDDNIPLMHRPLQAAMWLVKDGLIKVVNCPSENYIEEEWFAAVVVVIAEWYRERFGADALVRVRDTISGIVALHGVPVRLLVPTTISKAEVEGESSWLIFPDSIHESENILSFFLSKPSLADLSTNARIKLENRIAGIVERSRQSNLALQFASDLPPEAKQVRAGLWGHINKGVSDILTMKPAVAAIGAWELHFAVEKAFKVFLHQNGKNIFGHDLDLLAREARPLGLEVTEKTLRKMPSWKTAIQYRHAEKEIAIADAMAIYDPALQLIYEITSALRRDVVVNNAGFLIKTSKWKD